MGLTLIAAAAAGAFGASGSGPWASAAGVAKPSRDAAMKLLTTEVIPGNVIGYLQRGGKAQPEMRNPAAMDPKLEPGEAAKK